MPKLRDLVCAVVVALLATACLRPDDGTVSLRGNIVLQSTSEIFAGPPAGIALAVGSKSDRASLGESVWTPARAKKPPRWSPPTTAPDAKWAAGEVVLLLDGSMGPAALKENAEVLLRKVTPEEATPAITAGRVECVARRLCLLKVYSSAGESLGERETRELSERLNQALRIEGSETPAPIKRVATNAIYRALKLPDDPHYPKQRWHYEMLGLPGAWEISTGDAQMAIAVLDTGLNMRHEDFVGRLVPGIDLVSNPTLAGDGDGRDLDPTDPGEGTFFHGTHVAGTIGAASGNGIGGAGVTWLGRVQAVRVLGRGSAGTAFDILSGLYWAVGETDFETDDGSPGVPALNQTPARVVNLSLGAPFEEADHELWLATAQDILVERAEEFGYPIIVVAAGNENQPAENVTPANVPLFLTVGAHGSGGERAPYSNGGGLVDILAPGGSGLLDLDGNGVGDGIFSLFGASYGFLEGTSMAAPHAAGVAALALAIAPELRHEEVVALFLRSANKSNVSQADCDGCGAGRLDAFAALIQLVPLKSGSHIVVDRSAIVLRRDGAEPGRLRVANLGDEGLVVAAMAVGPRSDRFEVSTTPFVVGPGAIEELMVAGEQGPGNGSSASLVVRGFGAGNEQSGAVHLVSVGDEMPRKREIKEVRVEALRASTPETVNTGGTQRVVKSTVALAGDRFEWRLDLEPGSYLLSATGDDNGDGLFDDENEATGAWPTLGQPELLVVEDFIAQEVSIFLSGGDLSSGKGGLGAACADDDDCLWTRDAVCHPSGFCTRACDLDGFCGTGGVCSWGGCQDVGCGLCQMACTGSSQCPLGQVCSASGSCRIF